MNGLHDEDNVTLDYQDADDLWSAWAPNGPEDVLAQAAFDRTLRFALDLEDDGLYFRPGGWKIDLPASLARVACVAAILSAAFHVAGYPDVDREIIIAAAGFLASMDVRPVRPGRAERRLAERLRQQGLDGKPVTAAEAKKALPRASRRNITEDEVADALDLLVDAGIADREGQDRWVLRAEGSEAWIRLRLGRTG